MAKSKKATKAKTKAKTRAKAKPKKAAKKPVKKSGSKKATPKKKIVSKKKPVSQKTKKAPKKAVKAKPGKKIKPKKVKDVKKVAKKKKPVIVKAKATKKAVAVKPVKLPKPAANAKVVAPKSKIDAEERLHSKTQRIMKEIDETIGLHKVKPRIKVPVPTPKPRPVPVLKLPPDPVNVNKEKYQLEFEFRSSKHILFSYLSDSSGLAGWFADEVRSNDTNYTFVWEGSEVHAKMLGMKDQQLVRYQWTDENDGTYFQFEIKEDDITSDIALLITDWASKSDIESSKMIWESQVQKLRQLLGSL